MDTIKLPIFKRIKELRKNKGFTQGELAEKMNFDSKMISYYENGKSIPSVDALIKLAEIFDVSVDYLLFEDSPKRSLKQPGDKELIEQMSELDKLTEEDQYSIKHIIKSLIAKNKVKEFINKAS
jgi:transcriptional regulator with XRE-family HTH domain